MKRLSSSCLDTMLEIMVGAMAVSKPWTFVTGYSLFIEAVVKAKEDLQLVPERFRSAIDWFRFRTGGGFKESEDADDMFSDLSSQRYALKIAREQDRDGLANPGTGFCHYYIMDGLDAEEYLLKGRYTKEEIEWLWWFAQAAHNSRKSKKLERRERMSCEVVP